MTKFQVKIQSEDKIIATDGNISLKNLLNESGFVFNQHCGEKGKCGVCKIEYLKNPPTMFRKEIELFGKGSNFRLSCLQKISDDCEINIPPKKEFTVSKVISGLKFDSIGRGYGFAVDLGTTTVAVYFVDLHAGIIIDYATFLNPQSAFGSDIMTRLDKAKDEPNRKKLTESIQKIIADSISEILVNSDIDSEEVTRVVIAGNTAMSQLFCGLGGGGLEKAPYLGPFENKDTIPFNPEYLNLCKSTKCELLPVLSSFVGGDTCAAILAGDLDIMDGCRLLIDFGTNGEIVLAKHSGQAKRTLFVTSTAAGPAFEGEGMTFGMPALEGAVEGIDEKGNPLIIGGQANSSGICGSGYIAVISYLLNQEIIAKSGLLSRDNSGIRQRIIGNPDDKISITQEDIRKFQLAKGAIAAGIQLILDRARLTIEEIDEIIITGSFGNRIDPYSAINTGLIPDIPISKIRFLDNAAGRGAIISLAANNPFHRISDILEQIEYVNLAEHPHFQEVYVECMTFS